MSRPGARPPRLSEVHQLPPLVTLEPAELVEVLVDDEWFSGLANAYQGQRVLVTWTRSPGLRHLTWEPAVHVRRVRGDRA